MWAKGGSAEILAFEGDAVTLRSTIPSPPGSRLEAMLGELPIKVKVHGSKKEDDGTFTIRGRLFDATRDTRGAVLAAVKKI